MLRTDDTATKPVVVSTVSKRGAAEAVPRISRRELKLAYYKDPLTFNSINKSTQLMMAAGYKLKGESDSCAVVEDFLDNIGNTGANIDRDSLMELTLKNSMIFGSAYSEKIMNKTKNRILDLEVVDPEVIDYAKDTQGNVILDEHNNPIGYVETLQYGISKPRIVFPFPPNVENSGYSLYIPADRFMHFRLYSTGDGINDYGIVETVYKNIKMKMNIEDSFASFLARIGYPMLYAKVGDPTHSPTEEQIKSVLSELKGIRNKDVLATPYYADVSILEPKSPEKMQEHLTYFNEEIVAGLGVPQAFATGGGQETNRATLGRQEYLYKLSLKEVLKRVSATFEKQLFKPLCLQSKLKTWPKMVWNEIILEEQDAKAVRMANYAQAGLLTPDLALENYVRQLEDIPTKANQNVSMPGGSANAIPVKQ